jgi:tRNA pseudouridine55 synthase
LILHHDLEGILLVDKPQGKTSFSLVGLLRKTTGVKKIGHAGTLDPFATGLMILLIGKKYTRQSDHFLVHDKEYVTTLHLGTSTDSFDCEGERTSHSSYIPTLEEVSMALEYFQGTINQIPPMFSAKKVGGKKLYELARRGITIERQPVAVTVSTRLIAYEYPYLELHISCSKGTYIRSIGHDLGLMLQCGAHLTKLRRLRSGPFLLEKAVSGDSLYDIEIVRNGLINQAKLPL